MPLNISKLPKNFYNWVLNIKEEEDETFPNHFALIRLSDIAKSKGISDDSNKIITRFLNGVPVEEYPYSKEMVEAIKETYKIAVEQEKLVDDDFEFDASVDFGIVRYTP